MKQGTYLRRGSAVLVSGQQPPHELFSSRRDPLPDRLVERDILLLFLDDAFSD